MEAALTRIIVNNGDWDEACAKLKTTLQAQDAKFNAGLKAAFASPLAPIKPEAPAAGPQASTRLSPTRSSDQTILPRSRLRR